MNKLYNIKIGITSTIVAVTLLLFFCTNPAPIHHAASNMPAPLSDRNKPAVSLTPSNSHKVSERVPVKPASPVVSQSSVSNLIIPGRAMKTGVFTPLEQNSICLEGTSLTVPSGAIHQTRTLSVIGLLTEDLPAIPAEMVNVTRKYAGFRFLPHGMLFDSAAIISMAYDESLIPEGFTSKDIYTYYFDDSDRKWKALTRDSINCSAHLVVSNTLHFTDMINGIIKVPESPETAGYAPTSIKDIKAADPTSGITLIAPPSASNEGDASISFPFKIPGGRAGMQPQLGLQYSSGGGSGWTGYGWGLSVPGISVDASWGVPHYLTDKESETYLFGGSQLTPLAHRSEYVARTSEKRFYPRIEGGFSKIVRHGDNPTNYWWEATSKNGMRSFYGGTPEDGVIAQAVSADTIGNIGYWALVAMRDVHGNNVKYSYQKPEGYGQQMYVSEIIYTGKDTASGPYKVSFLRTDEANTYQRMDARINARNGFIERDKDLLRRINITYNAEIIRSYTLQYESGAFFKTLLKSVSELNAAGDTFYTHRFDYYDDVQANKGYVPFTEEKEYSFGSTDIISSFINALNPLDPLKRVLDRGTVLGGSTSLGGGGKVVVSVGLLGGSLTNKNNSLGGSVSYNGSTGKGQATLIDINGDGLLDKVFKNGDNIYYKPNILTSNNGQMFGDAHKINGISQISLSRTNGFGFGAEANAKYAYLGYTRTKSTTKTQIYFTDFNGDGLPDIAKKGTVYFNSINSNGDPVFTPSSSLTPNPLTGLSKIDTSMLPNAADEQATLEAQFPLRDAVRMWQAQYSGTIKISAPVNLIQDTSAEAMADTMKDGVKVSIQHKGDVLWSTEIDSGDYTKKIPDIKAIAITKGEHIYFRVQSRFNGYGDIVNWDPEITYTKITTQSTDSLIKWTDVNGKKLSHYKASEDFTLCGAQSVAMSSDGEISILSAFSKPITTDSLKLEIIKTDTSNIQTVILSRDYPSGKAISEDSLNIGKSVKKDESISFRVTSLTNIDWSKIKWNIELTYSSFSDGSSVIDYQGNPLFEFKPVAEFTQMYNDPLKHAKPVYADSTFMRSMRLDSIDTLEHPLKIYPHITYNTGTLSKYLDPTIDDTIVLSVKTPTKILAKQTILINNNKIAKADTLIANVTMGDSIFFEYHCNNRIISGMLDSTMVFINTDKQNLQKASVSYVTDPKNIIFGHLYRGWGQFDYNGNGERADKEIVESLLNLNDKKAKTDSELNDSSELYNTQSPSDDIFSVAIPYAKFSGYMGTDESVYISGQNISSSRLGQKNVYIEPYDYAVSASSGLTASDKITVETGNNFSGGASTKANASAGASVSNCNVYFKTDMADMNGDRYPDLLSENKIQYTEVSGGLTGSAISHGLGTHKAEASAYGFSLGGSEIQAKCVSTIVSNAIKSLKQGSVKVQQTDDNAVKSENTAKSNVGFTYSGSFSTNTDKNTETWMDINGDGLPDKLYSDGNVSLNLGYSFAKAEPWGFSWIREGKSTDYSLNGGLGVNYKNNSFSAGLGHSLTYSDTKKEFMDVNGDGLPDLVEGSNVMLNTGSGFADAVKWNGLSDLDAGESVGESANVGFTFGFPIAFLGIRILVSLSGSVSRGVSRPTTQLSDIDGDGYPDFLSSSSEDEIYVKSSTIGRTNMLKTVHRPMGSNFTVDYDRTTPTYKNPNSKWTLSSVKSFDGLIGDGVDTSLTTFSYANGYYNRRERQFYGFDTVKTYFYDTGNNNKVYRSTIQQYSNSDYYTKGIMLSETLFDGNGRKQTGSLNTYSLRDINTGATLPESAALSDVTPAFVALEETRQFLYLGAQASQITTRVTYQYDNLGNITGYTDYSTGNENDRVSVAIAYHSNAARYLYSIPSSQEVSTVEGLMRKRQTTIDDYGDITNISQTISDNASVSFDMEYDTYGNLTKITRPANYLGERMWYSYTYDSIVHSFITRVADAYGYGSQSAYDFKWGVPTQTIDKNNEKMQYTFDNYGRMKTVISPYEIASGKPYTIAFDYHPEAILPYAQTRHYDSIYNADIETYTFTDGLGRPVQVKKTAMLFTGANAEDSPGYVVSGKVTYDAFGRAVKAYQPVFEDASKATTYNATPDNIIPTQTSYDVLDRALQVTLPDGTKTSRAYGIGTYNGQVMHIDSLIDALGHVAVTYTDAQGQQVATALKASTGDIVTAFTYNALGELLAVTDPKGNKTLSVYDKLGRRTSVTQPDAGLTEFTYDAAGNLTRKITAYLRKNIPNGGAITYKYEYERLTEIVYPKNTQNKVEYTYGKPGATHHRAGRIELVQDASGGQEFFYGRMGEVLKTIRTIQLSETDMRTWIWSATYDTWNRVQTMTYPDGEVVSYAYNRAGNLQSMAGLKLGRAYDYISRIGYDKYEKQVYLQYGNGSVTTYNYEPERQRLAQMSVTSNSKELMNNAYTYDALNNILGITNSAAASGDIGGASSHSYSYDELNRLTGASGSFTGTTDTCAYTLAMQYDIMGNILRKNQSHTKNRASQAATTYDLSYKYEGTQPNAATQIGERQFTYDENGNQTYWEDTVTNDFRQMAWDEENRLQLIYDDGYLSNYTYDASGERVIKSHGGTQGVYINGASAGVINHTDANYTVYVSPYFVMKNETFTKHYYAGSSRVTSKIGNGEFENQYSSGVFEITAGSINYIARQQKIAQTKAEYYSSLGIPPGAPTMKGLTSNPDYTGTAIPDDTTGVDNSVPAGWPQKVVFAPAGGPPGAPIQWGDDITNETVEAGFGYVGTGTVEEDLRYFYHSDHLGSTSYITDAKGNAVQYIAYMPFGEQLAEQHADWDSPFKFNAKELDTETGLYYYGARYYDPKTSVWLGVDPLAEKFTNFSPFAYCMNNPVRLIDPSGMESITLYGDEVQANFCQLKNKNKTSDNHENNIATKYVDEKGNTLVDTNDKRNDVIVVRKQNQFDFEMDVIKSEVEGNLDKPETSDKLNNYGYNIKDMRNNATHEYPAPGNDDYNFGYVGGYERSYIGESIGKETVDGIKDIVLSEEASSFVTGKYLGGRKGQKDAKQGNMNMFDPKIKNNSAKIKRLKDSDRSKPNPNSKYYIHPWGIN